MVKGKKQVYTDGLLHKGLRQLNKSITLQY